MLENVVENKKAQRKERKNSDILNVVQIKPGINVKKDASKDDIEKIDKDEEDSDTNKLRNVDQKSTDKALMRKTTDPSEEGVGLGTNKSRAGEAATHKALRMLKDGKSYANFDSNNLMKLLDKDDKKK